MSQPSLPTFFASRQQPSLPALFASRQQPSLAAPVSRRSHLWLQTCRKPRRKDTNKSQHHQTFALFFHPPPRRQPSMAAKKTASRPGEPLPAGWRHHCIQGFSPAFQSAAILDRLLCPCRQPSLAAFVCCRQQPSLAAQSSPLFVPDALALRSTHLLRCTWITTGTSIRDGRCSNDIRRHEPFHSHRRNNILLFHIFQLF